MLKSILLVVDGSKAGKNAEKVAVSLACQHTAQMTGVGVLDITWLVEPLPEPFVGTAYSVYGAQEIAIEHKHISSALKEFSAACKEANVPYQFIEEKGSPARIIEDLSHTHDLIVIGQTTEFHYALEQPNDLTVKQVARDNPRPLLVVPETVVDSQRVLIAYDGSLQSARALHMFLLLGMGENKDVDILTLHKKQEKALLIAKSAQDLCKKYNINATVHALEESKRASEIILEQAKILHTHMIVMGAFSNPTIREVLFGSNTLDLIEKSKAMLFIHH